MFNPAFNSGSTVGTWDQCNAYYSTSYTGATMLCVNIAAESDWIRNQIGVNKYWVGYMEEGKVPSSIAGSQDALLPILIGILAAQTITLTMKITQLFGTQENGTMFLLHFLVYYVAVSTSYPLLLQVKVPLLHHPLLLQVQVPLLHHPLLLQVQALRLLLLSFHAVWLDGLFNAAANGLPHISIAIERSKIQILSIFYMCSILL